MSGTELGFNGSLHQEDSKEVAFCREDTSCTMRKCDLETSGAAKARSCILCILYNDNFCLR